MVKAFEEEMSKKKTLEERIGNIGIMCVFTIHSFAQPLSHTLSQKIVKYMK